MFDHLAIQCADLAASTRFYDAVLGPLGPTMVMSFDDGVVAYGTDAFSAPDRAAVDSFVRVAREHGAEVLHEPQEWPEYHLGYYGGFVRDPDGHNIEAVCHT